jgi:hypothetical protein
MPVQPVVPGDLAVEEGIQIVDYHATILSESPVTGLESRL